MFYRPDKKSVCADIIPFYENGEYKLFYLKDYRDIENYGEGCDWNLLTTKDLVNYQEHGTVIKRGTREEHDLYVYTGCVFKHNDLYYIFYTGHNHHLQNKPAEVVFLCTSKDFVNWEKVKDFHFSAPSWLVQNDFRDPFVFYDEEKKQFAMLLASRLKIEAPISSKGVTIIAYSDNLINWEVSKDLFFDPKSYYTHECPDLFRMGSWYYLVFSEFTDRFVTTYRMSKNLYGPWITPKVNTFDGHAFYAAKSASDGKKRYLFGWNPIKDKEQDDNLWQWGGNIVVHEIVQADDGLLYVKCPDSVKMSYQKELFYKRKLIIGNVEEKNNEIILGNNYGRSIMMNGEMPEICKIEFDFEITDEVGDFGIIIREGAYINNYYTIRFEPLFNRLSFDKWPRKERTQHTLTDVERYCPLNINAKNHIMILAQGSVLEVYVNDKVAMGTRTFDYRGNWGIYTQSTIVKFSNMRLFDRGTSK